MPSGRKFEVFLGLALSGKHDETVRRRWIVPLPCSDMSRNKYWQAAQFDCLADR